MAVNQQQTPTQPLGMAEGSQHEISIYLNAGMDSDRGGHLKASGLGSW